MRNKKELDDLEFIIDVLYGRAVFTPQKNSGNFLKNVICDLEAHLFSVEEAISNVKMQNIETKADFVTAIEKVITEQTRRNLALVKEIVMHEWENTDFNVEKFIIELIDIFECLPEEKVRQCVEKFL